ncbi:hypothetical protein AYI68_g7284 [Smittium mucronatum]|uniref:Uncharacterized protein n=1 Tax=Smittium mucronatum TaxID=133383 RepID=A0A1R0GP40_9FUNG|nr:hypothetical protein AYI68_g7284 [Smittium mucronatum]
MMKWGKSLVNIDYSLWKDYAIHKILSISRKYNLSEQILEIITPENFSNPLGKFPPIWKEVIKFIRRMLQIDMSDISHWAYEDVKTMGI